MTVMSADEFAEYSKDLDPYNDPPPDWDIPEPQCFYLSYITENGFTRYFYDHHKTLTRDKLQEIVKRMVRNIDKYNVPSTIPQDAPWTRKSYVVLVAEKQGLKLHRRKILVRHKDGLKKNHTFFTGWHWSLDISQRKRNRSVFACINHMRNESGQTLGPGEMEEFGILYPERLGRDRYKIHVLDDGNTNLGPPAPPPP